MSMSSPGGGGVGSYNASQTLDPGILVNVSAFTILDTLQFGDTWIEIGISDSPYDETHRRCALVSGYIDRDHPLAWHGYFPIVKDSLLYFKMTGNLDPIISVFEHRLTKTFMRNIQDFDARPTH